MKTVIIFYSEHHGNTRKLLEAIAEQCGAELLNAVETKQADLSGYDLIGFASGIYFSKFHSSVLEFAKNNLPAGKRVFLMYTCGSKQKSYTNGIGRVVREAGSDVIGEFGCKGYDTFGPFKLVGGISKDHPNAEDISGAVQFFRDISQK